MWCYSSTFKAKQGMRHMPLPQSSNPRIGIFGGMGAIAGSAFYYKLTRGFQGRREESQPMVFLLSDPTLPRRDKSVEIALENRKPLEFIHKILEGLAFFKEQNVDFVAVPCNTFHYFHEMFQRVSGVRILNMVEIVCRYALEQKPALKKIALLSTEATAKSAIYQKTFAAKNIEVVLPSVEERRKISFVIEQVKIGQAGTAVTREAIMQVINSMIHQGINTIILGCTELPEVSIQAPMQCLLIDTTQALVQGTIDAVELIKTEKSLGKIQSKL